MTDIEQAASGLAFALRIVTETMARADKDGGKTYDRMAENIARESGSGLVREALGYLPAESEDYSPCDPFRYRIGKSGRRQKKSQER